MLLQAEQIHKMTSTSLKMVKVVILSENSRHFVPKFNTENEDLRGKREGK